MNPVVGSHHRLSGPQWHTCIVINPAVGCHYFLPGPQLPSQLSGITALRPVPSYIAWWQRHIGVRHLPRVFTPWCPAETRTRDLLIASPTLYHNTTKAETETAAMHSHDSVMLISVSWFLAASKLTWPAAAFSTFTQVSNYTAQWRRNESVNNLLKLLCSSYQLEVTPASQSPVSQTKTLNPRLSAKLQPNSWHIYHHAEAITTTMDQGCEFGNFRRKISGNLFQSFRKFVK